MKRASKKLAKKDLGRKSSIQNLDPIVEKSESTEATAEAGEAESVFEETPPVDGQLTRIQWLLLDYKQFKAARIIQCYARRWYCRLIYARKRAAIINIQRWWRGFYYRRLFFRYLEDEVQRRQLKHHYDAAVRIQAWWRGWLVRMHVHDHYAMLREQLREAKELLHCVAYKLHYLVRTYQIPGIYSLRHTTALSKIEKLLVAINHWEYNAQEALKGKKTCAEMSSQEKQQGPCDTRCQAFYKNKDVEERMFRILKIYKEGSYTHARVVSHQQKIAAKKNLSPKPVKPKATFCSDILGSLCRSRFLNGSKMKLNPCVFKDAEVLNSFLDEMRSIYDNMLQHPSCVCLKTTNNQKSSQTSQKHE